MKGKKLFSIFFFLVSFSFIYVPKAFADEAITCNKYLDEEVSEDSTEHISCKNQFFTCQQSPFELEDQDAYAECIGPGKCADIVRWEYVSSPSNCPIDSNNELDRTYSNFQDGATHAGGNLKYCECIEDCYQTYRKQKDCLTLLESCCEKLDEYSAVIKDDDYRVVIESLKGDVEVKFEGKYFYRDAKEGDVLQMGDYISTGFESEVVIRFEKIALMTVKPMTNLAISQFFVEGNVAKTQVKLRMGLVRTKVQPDGRMKANIQFSPPNATIGVRGTEFDLSYDPVEEESKVIVHEGKVEVLDTDGKHVTYIEDGEEAVIDEDANAVIDESEPKGYKITILVLLIALCVVSFIAGAIGLVLFPKQKSISGIILASIGVVSLFIGGILIFML